MSFSNSSGATDFRKLGNLVAPRIPCNSAGALLLFDVSPPLAAVFSLGFVELHRESSLGKAQSYRLLAHSGEVGHHRRGLEEFLQRFSVVRPFAKPSLRSRVFETPH